MVIVVFECRGGYVSGVSDKVLHSAHGGTPE